MAYYSLRPDVPGEHGDNSVLDASVHPPRVSRLHLQIEGWFGDDLIKVFPCHVITDRLAEALKQSGLRAFELKDVEITTAPEAVELLGQLGIPEFPGFTWLDVTGVAGRDDIGVNSVGRMVVSDRALAVLRRFRLDRCDVEEFTD
jgi:hypothetical protein